MISKIGDNGEVCLYVHGASRLSVRKHARGCKAAGIEIFELLTAVGVKEKHVDSRIKALRVMGK